MRISEEFDENSEVHKVNCQGYLVWFEVFQPALYNEIKFLEFLNNYLKAFTVLKEIEREQIREDIEFDYRIPWELWQETELCPDTYVALFSLNGWTVIKFVFRDTHGTCVEAFGR